MPWARSYQALVHVWRGEVAKAAALQSQYLSALREIGDLQLLTPALVIAARTEFAQANTDGAALLLDEFIEVTRGKSPVYRGWLVNDAVRLLVAVGSATEAEALAAESDAPGRRNRISVATAKAALAEANGDYEGALGQYEAVVADWADFGYVLEHGLALCGAGRCLAALGRPGEAAQPLAAAREILAKLGAAPTIAEIDALEEQAAAL